MLGATVAEVAAADADEHAPYIAALASACVPGESSDDAPEGLSQADDAPEGLSQAPKPTAGKKKKKSLK